jgi:outer membrane protein OmpA-like peptidoglycan-associated protein
MIAASSIFGLALCLPAHPQDNSDVKINWQGLTSVPPAPYEERIDGRRVLKYPGSELVRIVGPREYPGETAGGDEQTISLRRPNQGATGQPSSVVASSAPISTANAGARRGAPIPLSAPSGQDTALSAGPLIGTSTNTEQTKPAVERRQLAMRPPTNRAQEIQTPAATLLFVTGENTLGQSAKAELDRLAARFANKDHPIHVHGFSDDPNDHSSDARRLSLRRALAVRKHLVDKGILEGRIRVRAFGGPSNGGAVSRVDIMAPGG